MTKDIRELKTIVWLGKVIVLFNSKNYSASFLLSHAYVNRELKIGMIKDWKKISR